PCQVGRGGPEVGGRQRPVRACVHHDRRRRPRRRGDPHLGMTGPGGSPGARRSATCLKRQALVLPGRMQWGNNQGNLGYAPVSEPTSPEASRVSPSPTSTLLSAPPSAHNRPAYPLPALHTSWLVLGRHWVRRAIQTAWASTSPGLRQECGYSPRKCRV